MTGWRTLFAFAAAVLALALAPGGLAQRLDRQVRIVNDTSVAIVEFSGAPAGTAGGRNILGEATLAAGSSLDVDFEDGSGYCLYDFRALFDDGGLLERKRVNVCAVGTYRYTD